jgi:DNA-binding NarL/FixJ family response regulator
MPPGPGRRAAAEALRGAGLRVRTAREPYEGTARFVQRPADLVVLSMEGFRSRDTAFVETVKRRAPATRVLLLVPEGRRAAAVKALRAGADAYALDPFYPDELRALASALLRDVLEEEEASATRSVGRLASEVSHAVNNPLQILALLGESEEVPETVRTSMLEEVGRIQAVVRILGRFGLLRKPQRGLEPIGPVLRQSLDAAARDGAIRPVGEPPEDGPPVSVDTSQAAVAFDGILGFLAARAEEKPLAVRARVRTAPRGRPAVEAALKAAGLHIEKEALEALRETVLLSRDDTREVYPGLALAEAVARNHGGRFIAQPTEDGAVLGLRLPLEP